jgi:hypothetical protein
VLLLSASEQGRPLWKTLTAALGALGGAAQVAPLDGFPERTLGSAADWTVPFRGGAAGVVCAVASGGRGRGAKRWTELLGAWRGAPALARVMVMFARADVDAARTVQAALERAGYLTYFYLDEPEAPADLLARLFGNAGNRLVIDTANARQSAGVQWAARASENLARTVAVAGKRRSQTNPRFSKPAIDVRLKREEPAPPPPAYMPPAR